MENLKVRVKSSVEVKQAHAFGFSTGYTKPFGDFGLTDGWVCFDSEDKHILDVCISQAGDELKEFKEITLQQLRDLTLEQQVASYNIEQQASKADPKLFLDPTQNYAEIEWDGSFMKQDHWIEVPEGVNYLYMVNEHGNTVFTVLEMGYRDSSILWQRTQDNSLPFIDDITLETATGSQLDSLAEHLCLRGRYDGESDADYRYQLQHYIGKPFVDDEPNIDTATGCTLDTIAKNNGYRKRHDGESDHIYREGLKMFVCDTELINDKPQGIDATLAERQSTYGSFEDVAMTTQDLLGVLQNSGYDYMPKPHKEALHMICSKIARIVNGDCNHKDSWHDIAGYAKLIEDLL